MVWFSFFGGIVQGAVAPVVNGLTLVACIYSVVSISGAHVNAGWLHSSSIRAQRPENSPLFVSTPPTLDNPTGPFDFLPFCVRTQVSHGL